MIDYVIYRRVSVKEQDRPGLGTDAQSLDIELFLSIQTPASVPALTPALTPASVPASVPALTPVSVPALGYRIIGEFVDIQPGKVNCQVELEKALALVREKKATLLVAKLDRLSCCASFIAGLMADRSVRFRVATMPDADEFQLHIYSDLAEQERKFIGRKRQRALAAAKARGAKPGRYSESTRGGNNVRAEEARQRAEKLRGAILPLQKARCTLMEMAAALNLAGIPAANGGGWSPTQVRRVIQRLK